jgi:hypothetical protein
MIIEAAKGGHTQVVKLLLEYPNRVLMNGSPEIEQLPEPHLNEVCVKNNISCISGVSVNMLTPVRYLWVKVGKADSSAILVGQSR